LEARVGQNCQVNAKDKPYEIGKFDTQLTKAGSQAIYNEELFFVVIATSLPFLEQKEFLLPKQKTILLWKKVREDFPTGSMKILPVIAKIQ